MIEREAIFHPKALETLRGFSKDTRAAVGKAIREIQRGRSLTMPISRAMPTIALGASELRIRDRHGIYRAFYYVKSSRGILIFHACMKKTRQMDRTINRFFVRRGTVVAGGSGIT